MPLHGGESNAIHNTDPSLVTLVNEDTNLFHGFRQVLNDLTGDFRSDASRALFVEDESERIGASVNSKFGVVKVRSPADFDPGHSTHQVQKTRLPNPRRTSKARKR